LLLAAFFQSFRMALVAISAAPAAMAGVVVVLWITGTTLNLQSFIGSIMAIGVAMANAILLVTFAEESESRAPDAASAARGAAASRVRPILMTAIA